MTSIDNRKAVARAAAECHAISLDEDAGDFCATRVQYCDARAIAGLQCQSFVHFDHAPAGCGCMIEVIKRLTLPSLDCSVSRLFTSIMQPQPAGAASSPGP